MPRWLDGIAAFRRRPSLRRAYGGHSKAMADKKAVATVTKKGNGPYRSTIRWRLAPGAPPSSIESTRCIVPSGSQAAILSGHSMARQ
jgi:hypothetical protein